MSKITHIVALLDPIAGAPLTEKERRSDRRAAAQIFKLALKAEEAVNPLAYMAKATVAKTVWNYLTK